jgi:hypothetical protein
MYGRTVATVSDSERYQDPDEIQLRERLRDYDLKSLDLCYEEAKTALYFQVRNVESLAKRNTSLLGFLGVLLIVLIAVCNAIPGNVDIPLYIYMLIGFSGVFLIISALCCLVGPGVRALKGAPKPERLVQKYITWATDLVKYQHVYEILRAIRLNEKALNMRSCLLKAAMVCLFIALCGFFTAFLTLLFL